MQNIACQHNVALDDTKVIEPLTWLTDNGFIISQMQ